MEAIETLKLLKAEYTNYINNWCSKIKSAENSVNDVFEKLPIKPCIYKDIHEDPSHIFFGGYVFFFDGCEIHKEI